jgi:N-acyl-D-aspartate/D-glutamate deacylase
VLGCVIRDGVLVGGMGADIVVFDKDEVGPSKTDFKDDMPAGGSRLYGESKGSGVVAIETVRIP